MLFMTSVILVAAVCVAATRAAVVPVKVHNAAMPRVTTDQATAVLDTLARRYPHLTKPQVLRLAHAYKVAFHEAANSTWLAEGTATADAFNANFGDAFENFPCSAMEPSETEPTTVDKVRPADIQYVTSVGDSLVAAFGALARTLFQITTEYRQVSYTNGGVTPRTNTVANFLSVYNDAVQGASVGTGNRESANAKLNAAVSGAKGCDMAAHVDYMVERMKADYGAASVNAWKVTTMMVGPNNACVWCEDKDANSVAKVANCVDDGLRKLFDQTNRTFVNLVGVFDVTKLHKFSSGTCRTIHDYACPCGVDDNDANREELSAVIAQYNEKFAELAAAYSARRDDFEVVFQPFTLGTDIPTDGDGNVDMSYLAPDCFHFSGKAHKAAAIALWNNMFEATDDKSDTWVPGADAKCPTDDAPYLRTNNN